MFNQDLEPNRPESTLRLKREIEAADAILIVTPEHNRSIPAVLKNAIDWASRPYGKNSWAGKTVAVTGTSGGAVGTAVSQNELRMILTNLAGVVVGGQIFVTFKDDLVDAEHNVTNEATTPEAVQDRADDWASCPKPRRTGWRPCATSSAARSRPSSTAVWTLSWWPWPPKWPQSISRLGRASSAIWCAPWLKIWKCPSSLFSPMPVH